MMRLHDQIFYGIICLANLACLVFIFQNWSFLDWLNLVFAVLCGMIFISTFWRKYADD